ncbi:unnamed protein product [Orchesella dallaii]|uniref:Uncharacterized protein n=1 Tax=Orchesella dallaii TaxID=48710 RepID=A0ABP1RAT4_9HEXA
MKLFPRFNDKWAEHVIYFYKTKNLLDNLFISDSSIHSRSLTLMNSSTLDRGTYRFSNTFNIAISPIIYGSGIANIATTLRDLSEALVPSRTLFIFVLTNTGRWTPADLQVMSDWQDRSDMQIFPALKIIVSPPPNFKCELKKISLTVICSGYCESKNEILNFRQELHQNELYSAHRALFWNGNTKSITGLIKNHFHCIRVFRLFAFAPDINIEKALHHHCKADVLTLSVFAMAHNLTLFPVKKTPKTIAAYGVGRYFDGTEHITSGVEFLDNIKPPLSFVSRFKFDEQRSAGILYCPSGPENYIESLEFSMWHQPFSLDIWLISMIFTVGFVALCCFTAKSLTHCISELVEYISVVLGQGRSMQARYLVIICSMMFLCNLYANDLTSIVTVRLPPKGHRTVKELLNDNYKIAILKSDLWNSIRKQYGTDFKYLGIPELIGKAFVVMNNISYVDGIIEMMGNKGTRLAVTFDYSTSKSFVPSIRKDLKKKDKSFNCFVLEQRLRRRQFLWEFLTENQYWLEVTLGRILASGLYFKWDEWAVWFSVVRNKLHEQETSPKSDYVNIMKFLSVFCIWIGLISSWLTVFWVEIGGFKCFSRHYLCRCEEARENRVKIYA